MKVFNKEKMTFWEFCRRYTPEFFNDSNTHTKKVCEGIQQWHDSGGKKEIIITPPRQGKDLLKRLYKDYLKITRGDV